MAAVGSACLLVALLCALYAVGASLYGARNRRRSLVESSRRAVYALAALTVAAFVVLEAAYLRSDLSFDIVVQSSSTDTPTFYKLTGLWSTQEGSLMLWGLVLSIFSAAVLRATRHSLREVAPYATAVLGAIAAFFLSLTVFVESPFTTLATPAAAGNGLNPLLRNPVMMIHPPMLYSGYVAFSIPFAFAIGALVTRRTGADWIRATRRFALIAWSFLGLGILLGALWSYSELGWGGYWAWDPVENASLIVATFVLSLLRTFLVRSGVLSSIHAFGASTLGAPFLAFIGLVLLGSVALVLARLPDLRSEARLDSLASREAVFLLNNLLLVGLCFVIFWGTFFSLISEAVTGTESSVGPPWFDRYVMPLALALVAFTPAEESLPSLVLFALLAFVLAVVAQELGRGAAARRTMTGEAWPL